MLRVGLRRLFHSTPVLSSAQAAIAAHNAKASGSVASVLAAAPQMYPRKVAGVSPAVNWSLADDRITPAGQAFRNASLSDLVSASWAPSDKDGVLSIPAVSSAAVSSVFLVEGTLPTSALTTPAAGINANASLSLTDYNAVMRSVTGYLSQVPQVWVADGTVGSHRSAETGVRVVSDNSVSSLAAQILLNRIPRVNDPMSFVRSARVFVAPGFAVPADLASKLPKGLSGDAGAVIVNLRSKVAAILGSVSVTLLQQTLSSLGSFASKAPVFFGSIAKNSLIVGRGANSRLLFLAEGPAVSFGFRAATSASPSEGQKVVLRDGVSNTVLQSDAGIASRPNLVKASENVVLTMSNAKGVSKVQKGVSEDDLAALVLASLEGVVLAADAVANARAIARIISSSNVFVSSPQDAQSVSGKESSSDAGFASVLDATRARWATLTAPKADTK
ncbi:mitochondrial phosphoenolpyruvate carboxykinase [Andalucia godoyi]|uniref:Mitochondrial phosphoenolpyruvate carboxykinase n=1 Tax=Andalucia godoyi TaxID=505711 RepID=A0A8K0F0T7_ANDGO|nr:mitochondrial phosphoenolpyruvate carboxykinase [Andalucia godoyi]|eukprot:ANDGO_03560.mRNA.1 mitochondrial phosphoenolpyruvate carboxykinase